AIDDIVGYDRARKGEFGEDRHFTRTQAGIAADLAVIGAVEAHGGEGAVADVIVGDNDLIGLEDVDAVAVLPIAATAPVDIADAVGHDDGAVGAGLRAPDADAGIAAMVDAVAGDVEPTAVHRMDGRVAQFAKGAVAYGDRGIGDGYADIGTTKATALQRYGVAGLDGESRHACGKADVAQHQRAPIMDEQAPAI